MFDVLFCLSIIHVFFVILKCFGQLFSQWLQIRKIADDLRSLYTLLYNKRTTSTELGEAQRGLSL